MAQYDGSIRINTEINVKSAKVQLMAIENQMSKTADRIAALKSKMDSLGNMDIPTNEYQSLEKELSKLGADYERIVEKQQRFLSSGGKEGSSLYKKMEYDLDSLDVKQDRVIAKMKEMEATGKAFIPGTASEEYGKIYHELKNLENHQKLLNQKHDLQKEKIKEAGKGYRRLGNQGRKVFDELNRSIDSGPGSLKNFSSRFKSILLSCFVFGWITKGFNAMISDVKDGFRNLYNENKTFKKSVDGLSASTLTLKNSFASAFAPIAQIAIPYIQAFIDRLAVAMDKFAQFTALITGQKKYMKAVKQTTAAIEAQTAASNKQLSSLDNLNNLSENSGGGGSTGGTATGYFEEADVEGTVKSYEELGEAINKSLTDMINGIDWEKTYEGARNYGRNFAKFLNGLISPELFGATGTLVAGSLNSAVYFALELGSDFDFKEAGESIAAGINNFFETFDFKALAETLNVWARGIREGIKAAVDTIDPESIISGAFDFLDNLELSTIVTLLGIKWVLSGAVAQTASAGLASLIGSKVTKPQLAVMAVVGVLGFKIGEWLSKNTIVGDLADQIADWLVDDENGGGIRISRALIASVAALTLSLTAVKLSKASFIKLGDTLKNAFLSDTVSKKAGEGFSGGLSAWIANNAAAISAIGATFVAGLELGKWIDEQLGDHFDTALEKLFGNPNKNQEYKDRDLNRYGFENGLSYEEFIKQSPAYSAYSSDQIDDMLKSGDFDDARYEYEKSRREYMTGVARGSGKEADKAKKALASLAKEVKNSAKPLNSYSKSYISLMNDLNNSTYGFYEQTDESLNGVSGSYIKNSASVFDFSRNLDIANTNSSASANALKTNVANALSRMMTSGNLSVASLANTTMSLFGRMNTSGVSNTENMSSGMVAQFSSLMNKGISDTTILSNTSGTQFNKMKNDGISNANMLSASVGASLNLMKTLGMESVNGLVNSAVSAFPKVNAGAKIGLSPLPGTVAGLVSQAANNITSQRWNGAGINLVQGLANGIESQWGMGLTAKIIALSTSLTSTLKKAFKIHSPSREWYAVGEFLDAGLGNAIMDGKGDLLANVGNIAKSMTNALEQSVKGTNVFADMESRFGVIKPNVFASLEKYGIPEYATGKVLPVSMEKHFVTSNSNRETESALSLSAIEQVVDNVMQKYRGAAESITIRVPVILNDKEIAEAVWDQTTEEFDRRGGRLPFPT